MKVIIPRNIFQEIDYYVQKSPIEISGLGRVVKHDNGDMEVVKVYLLDQENTSVHTEIDGEAVAKLMYESREDEGDLNFWWHSHVDMGVNWSGTDYDTMQEFGKNGYLLSTVFNKRREKRSAYYQGATQFLPALRMDDLETVINDELPKSLTDTWDAEYKAKAKKAKPVAPILTGRHGWQGSMFEELKHIGQPKKRKRGRPKKKKDTVLGTDDDLMFTQLLDSYLNPHSIAEWRECLGFLRNEDPVNVSDHHLWRFYETWDGDVDSMKMHVIGRMAEQEEQQQTERRAR